MIQWREGEVLEERPGWPGVTELVVAVRELGEVRALAYPDVVGTPRRGDRVLLNTTALDRGLGTGGYALVVAVPDRPEAWPSRPADRRGHLVKDRYSPTQTMVLGVDDPDGPHHSVLADADDLAGMPVVAADLHSALPAIVAGARTVDQAVRIAYVLTDGGALPATFSRTCADLRREGWLAAVITAGQSYGGDLEAVTVHTALLAAHLIVEADVAVVAQGPGNLGTGTRWGFSGVSAGEALNAAGALGGRAVGSLRVSEADLRDRHRGLSHHSATAYGRVLARPADLVVPVDTDPATGERTREVLAEVAASAEDLARAHPHLSLVEVGTEGLLDALAGAPVRLSTMGRGLSDDPASFLAAAAAGRYAARLAQR